MPATRPMLCPEPSCSGLPGHSSFPAPSWPALPDRKRGQLSVASPNLPDMGDDAATVTAVPGAPAPQDGPDTADTSMPDRARRVLSFAAAVGARPDEARLLQWPEVDLRTATCVLSEHKTARSTGKPRTLYLTRPAIAILKALPGPRTGYVFLSRLGRPYTTAGLRSILRRRAPISPYQLRHTFGQIASEQADQQMVAAWMGHQDVRTTRHYFEVRDQRARAGAAKLVLPHLQSVRPRSRPASAPAAKRKARRRTGGKPRARSA